MNRVHDQREVGQLVAIVEVEEYLALNAYLCFCSAWGCFLGAVQCHAMVALWIDEMFYMGAAFAVIGFVMLKLADLRVPTAIWFLTARKIKSLI